jgi:hypothetical protein
VSCRYSSSVDRQASLCIINDKVERPQRKHRDLRVCPVRTGLSLNDAIRCPASLCLRQVKPRAQSRGWGTDDISHGSGWARRKRDEQVFHATVKIYRYNFDVWMGSVDDGRFVPKDNMVMMTQDDAMRSSA